MQLHKVVFRAMGSPCSVRLFAQSQQEAEQLAQPAKDEVARLEATYSRYLPDSLLSCVNAQAGTGASTSLPEEAVAILNYAYQAWEQSDGLFDVTSGVLRRVWDFRSQQLPSQESIDRTLPLIGMDKLHWSEPELNLPLVGMQLDFGGCVKEYAADAAANACRQQGVTSGIVELGGDVSVIGPQPNGAPWAVGIRNPLTTLDAAQAVERLHLASGGLASSGDYERCMIVNGKRYSHILNPKTGWPVQTPAQVSVLADNCLVAGTVSTVAMLKGEAGCLGWLDAIGLPYYLIFRDGRVVNTL